MNVIRCTVNNQRCSLNFTDDASEVGKQISAKLWLDQRPTSLGAEDQMQQNIAKCMRQVFRPCRGFSLRSRPPTACAVGCILVPLPRLVHHHSCGCSQSVMTVTLISAMSIDLLWQKCWRQETLV